MVATIFWVVVFLGALAALVKGSDWLVLGAERISLALGMTDMRKLPVKLTRRVLQGLTDRGYKVAFKSKMLLRDAGYIALGAGVLSVGAKYLIDSVLALSAIWGVSAGAITIIAVAVGTSLPELIVSAKAAMKGKSEIALGNIFGSNAFNILVVVGLPGMFTTLQLDTGTLYIGVPTMVLATFLFVFSGISRRIHSWEGGLYIIGYIIFTGKIFRLF